MHLCLQLSDGIAVRQLMGYDGTMTDNPKINVPVFLVPVPQEVMLAMKSYLVRVKESVSIIEQETGKLLTAGNRARDNAMVSFGHDVFSLLFSFPAKHRSLTTFFNQKLENATSEVKSGDVSKIYEFFSRLEYKTLVPADKTRRGRLYPARWDMRENIPCLLRKVESVTEMASSHRNGLDVIMTASLALNATCKEALEIWRPFMETVRIRNKEWRETTLEGQAYDEAFRKRMEEILAGK